MIPGEASASGADQCGADVKLAYDDCTMHHSLMANTCNVHSETTQFYSTNDLALHDSAL